MPLAPLGRGPGREGVWEGCQVFAVLYHPSPHRVSWASAFRSPSLWAKSRDPVSGIAHHASNRAWPWRGPGNAF